MEMIRGLEQRKNGYDDLVVQGEEALNKICDNSQRVVNSIEDYCDDISGRY